MSGFLLVTNVISELVRPAPDARVVRRVDETDQVVLYPSLPMPGDIRKGIMALGRKARCGTLEAWLETELADASLELESSCAALYQRTEYYHTVSRGGALTRRQCEKELEEENSYVENE